MTPANLHTQLDKIEQSAPVHKLARQLIKAGWTEAQLLETLGNRKGSVIGVELQNAFRDLERGHRHVTTRYWKQITV